MCSSDLKRKVAEDGKYILQRKLENLGAAFSAYNNDLLTVFYKLPSQLDLFYKIAIKAIDLKELKEFQILGDKLELPKPAKPAVEHKVEPGQLPVLKKDVELIIFDESSDRILYHLANCCKPIPGDDVFGFVTTGKGQIGRAHV